MGTQEIIQKLQKEKYTISIISRQSGVPYMRIYRYMNSGGAMSDAEQASIRAFALVQPCFTRGAHE